MREFRIRTDIERAVVNGYALPLGLVPGSSNDVAVPAPGYTVEFTPGEGDQPDTYLLHAVVSHDRLVPLVERTFGLLPPRVHPIVEIGSRDAYRSVDVYMAPDPIDLEQFLEAWTRYGEFLLEDGSIGCGANSDDPFVEVFLDQWKGLSVHVPPLMLEEVEGILGEAGLEAVAQTWPPMDEDTANAALQLRSVLAIDDEFSPGVEEMLLELRHAWGLELNVDPDTNVDEAGRPIGATLWHAMIIVDSTQNERDSAYASVWATAGSLAEMERLIDKALADYPDWRFGEIYTIDRVAFDERPDELADLAPRREAGVIHLVEFDW
jgi:hypothetical protein